MRVGSQSEKAGTSASTTSVTNSTTRYFIIGRATSFTWVPVIAHGVTNGVLGAWVLITGQWSFW